MVAWIGLNFRLKGMDSSANENVQCWRKNTCFYLFLTFDEFGKELCGFFPLFHQLSVKESPPPSETLLATWQGLNHFLCFHSSSSHDEIRKHTAARSSTNRSLHRYFERLLRLEDGHWCQKGFFSVVHPFISTRWSVRPTIKRIYT